MLRHLFLASALTLGLASTVRAQTYEPGQNYVVRQGQLPYAGRTQYSVNVVVDGPEDQTRDFFQDYMKSANRISFKGGLAGLLGKKGVLTAKQVAGGRYFEPPGRLVRRYHRAHRLYHRSSHVWRLWGENLLLARPHRQ